jgi:hypothetical protein
MAIDRNSFVLGVAAALLGIASFMAAFAMMGPQ